MMLALLLVVAAAVVMFALLMARPRRIPGYTSEHNRQALAAVFRPEGRFRGIRKHLNIPRDFALVNRLWVGVTSIN